MITSFRSLVKYHTNLMMGVALYVGHSVNGKTKKRLPEGWSIGVSDEYYGLRYYNDGEKTHWKHPLE